MLIAMGFSCAWAGLMRGNAVSLEDVVRTTVQSTMVQFATDNLKPDELCISLSKLDRSKLKFEMADFHGDTPMYPASVVKLFFAAYLGHRLDQNKIKLTPEIERATKDMLVESSNDATGLILDVITETTGGSELPPNELKKWMKKRQAVNDWFVSLGFSNVNACQKTWNEGPYGRERQGYGPNWELRNSLTANSCGRLLSELALAKNVSVQRSNWLLGFMKRQANDDGDDSGHQTKGFLGEGIPKGWARWSKAGWAYQVRHDVCLFATPAGEEYVLTVFTDHHGSNEKLLPFVSSEIVRLLLSRQNSKKFILWKSFDQNHSKPLTMVLLTCLQAGRRLSLCEEHSPS